MCTIKRTCNATYFLSRRVNTVHYRFFFFFCCFFHHVIHKYEYYISSPCLKIRHNSQHSWNVVCRPREVTAASTSCVPGFVKIVSLAKVVFELWASFYLRPCSYFRSLLLASTVNRWRNMLKLWHVLTNCYRRLLA